MPHSITWERNVTCVDGLTEIHMTTGIIANTCNDGNRDDCTVYTVV